IHGDIDRKGHYEAVMQSVNDCYHQHHNTHITHYNQNSAVGHFGGYCPPGNGPGYGGGNGLLQQHWCPGGACPGHCPPGNQSWYPKHGFSYSYETPNDLVYPPAGGIGGATVYPYYTHKGPSDFFRAE